MNINIGEISTDDLTLIITALKYCSITKAADTYIDDVNKLTGALMLCLENNITLNDAYKEHD